MALDLTRQLNLQACPPAVQAVYQVLQEHEVTHVEDPVFRWTESFARPCSLFESRQDAWAYRTVDQELEVTVVFRLRRSVQYPESLSHGHF